MPRESRIRTISRKTMQRTYMHIQNMCVNMYISMWVFSGFKYQIFYLFSIGKKGHSALQTPCRQTHDDNTSNNRFCIRYNKSDNIQKENKNDHNDDHLGFLYYISPKP